MICLLMIGAANIAVCRSTAKLGKGHAVLLDPAIGESYGSLYQLSGDGKTLRRAKR